MSTLAPPPDDAPPAVLWRNPDSSSSNMARFQAFVEKKRARKFKDYFDLHRYSITELASFYADLWEFANLIHEGHCDSIVDETAPVDTNPTWFPGIRLNYAENCLYTRGPAGERTTVHKEDGKTAVTMFREGGTEMRSYTWGELRRRVGLVANALRAAGVQPQDRVGAVVSNSYDTLCIWLASAAVGAIYSSSSTDMGTRGILDRLLQIEPMWVFADDTAVYNGKLVDLRPKIRELVEGMGPVKVFKGIVSLSRFDTPADIGGMERVSTWKSFLDGAKGDDSIVFTRIGFRDPLCILYSSGTTGKPKCIIHSVGSILLNNCFKELTLSHGVDHKSTYLQFTTTGWVMYLMAVGPLFTGAHTLLYDGSPFHPTPKEFIRLAGQYKVTHMGLGPRYFTTLRSQRLAPCEITDLSSLRHVTSTGMMLSASLIQWFYNTGYPRHVHLVNMTGGTDLAGAFAHGIPTLPVYADASCQAPALGMDVRVLSPTTGEEVPDGTPGELIVARPFPSMPIDFWGAGGAAAYRAAYFTRFPKVWTQGDFCVRVPAARGGGLLMLGRADGVLNPSGVRFGSADLYAVIEAHFSDAIADALAVGQRRAHDPDEQVLLFLVMRPGHQLTPAIVDEIKTRIATEYSKRHVPKYFFQAPAIPVTVNGKKVESPVKLLVSSVIGVETSATIANPECLKWFERFVDVENVGVDGTRRESKA